MNFFEKSLNLANFVNFADLPQGGRVVSPLPPIGEPSLLFINYLIKNGKFEINIF